MRLHLTLSEDATRAVNEAADEVTDLPREPNTGKVTELLILIGYRQFMGFDSVDLCEELTTLCRPAKPKRRKVKAAIEANEPHELDPDAT